MDNFQVTELGRALAEQHFGIINSRIDHETCTGDSAFAFVKLLEQREIRVKLSNSGYEVVNEIKLSSEEIQPQVFETLDDLLLAVSPKYRERRAEELMSRLSQLEERGPYALSGAWIYGK